MFKRLPGVGQLRGLMFAGLVSLLAGCGGGEKNAEPPATAPAAPTNPSATAGDASIAIAWTASSGAVTYHVKRATTSGGPYSQVGAPASTSYSDNSLTNGTIYYYVISALNAAGESANSAQVSATPIAPVVVPAAPAGLTATPANAQVTLNWSASSGATGYHVKRGTSSGGPYAQITTLTATSHVDTTGLTNGTTYYYIVTAENSAGESTNSTQASATPLAPVVIPAVPAGLTALAGDAQVTLNWSATSGATSYRLKRSTTSGSGYTQISMSTATSYVDAGRTNGTTYYYVVTAVNTAGESANSTQASATPTAPVVVPPAPTGLVAAAGNAQVTLNWSTASGATSYRVKRSTTSGSGYTQISTPTGTSHVDTGLTNGTTYYYVVSAVNPAGESTNSSQASATPAAPIPPAPTGLTATAGNTQVSLSWSAASGATSYRVKRSTTSGSGYAQVAMPTGTSHTDTSLANGTTYYYVVSAANASGESANSTQASATPATSSASVTITVAPGTTHAISPYIYGVNNAFNSNVFPAGGSSVPGSLTFDRLGGNRLTAYNWETNASNAGSDYNYQNDNLFPGSVPASAVSNVITANQAGGLATLFTVQMQGFVAADIAGPVNMTNPPSSAADRFKTVIFKKSDASAVAFTATPDTTDANVYMDEFVWTVNQRFNGQGIFSTSPTTKPVFVSLDNEPELWRYTHREIQGDVAPASTAYITSTINLANALKALFPDLVIFGPAHYGFAGIYTWQDEPGLSPWFTDKYLTAIKNASANPAKPLVDVYDFHWYPEATDGNGNRVINLNGTALNDAQVQAIVQSPRSLWDTTYTESSWIPSAVGGPIYLLPRLQSKINASGLNMKMSITEYNNGGARHIAGTIAQADNLGVFGAQGLFAANLWKQFDDESYLLGGFRAFRNFDGANHHFGNTSVQAVSSDTSKVAAYVSTDTTVSGRVVMVVINRSNATQTVAISGQPLAGTAHLFQMTAASASGQTTIQPVAAGTQAASGSSITLTVPALSVTTADIY